MGDGADGDGGSIGIQQPYQGILFPGFEVLTIPNQPGEVEGVTVDLLFIETGRVDGATFLQDLAAILSNEVVLAKQGNNGYYIRLDRTCKWARMTNMQSGGYDYENPVFIQHADAPWSFYLLENRKAGLFVMPVGIWVEGFDQVSALAKEWDLRISIRPERDTTSFHGLKEVFDDSDGQL